MSTETMSELQRAADQAEKGVKDPEAMRLAIEQMRARLEASKALGTEPFAANILRQFRGNVE
jgi:hypothetical protein